MNLIRTFLLITLFSILSYAQVLLNVPEETVRNEPIIFSIDASGDSIKFPDLSSINGKLVQEISSSTSTNIINSQITKRVKKVYSLYADSTFVFPKLEFIIDGESVFTNEKEIKIVDASKTKSDVFDLSIKSNKEDLFVGEDFILTIVFKHKKYAQIVDLNLIKPSFNDFWYKPLNDIKQYEEGDYKIQELKFLLFPLKAGALKINPITIQAQIVDPRRTNYSFFNNGITSEKVYSNAISFDIKKLPQNVDLIGDFNIEASIDKSKIKLGESISYKLKISGFGNFDDLKDIKLNIDKTTIYENKPEIKTEFVNDKYKGIYTKVFSIIPNESLEIPALELKYFNKELNKLVIKKTEKFKIEIENIVENKKIEKLQKLQENVPTKEIVKVIERSSLKDKILYFSLGIITMSLILSLYFYVIKQREKKEFNELPLIKKVKKSKTKDELLKVLFMYVKKDDNLDKLIYQIEDTNDLNTLKKEIIKLLKQIDIKGKIL